MIGQSVLRECLLAADVEEMAVLVRSPLTQQYANLKQLVVADLFAADNETEEQPELEFANVQAAF